VHDLRVLLQILAHVVAALQPGLAHREPGARLVYELQLHGEVYYLPDLRDSLAVDDVELRLLEGGRDLVLYDLGPGAVAYHLGAVLERFDAAHVYAHAGEILERAAARRRLRVAVHDAYLLAQLVYEDDYAAGLRHDAREFAQRLAHEPRHDADAALA